VPIEEYTMSFSIPEILERAHRCAELAEGLRLAQKAPLAFSTHVYCQLIDLLADDRMMKDSPVEYDKDGKPIPLSGKPRHIVLLRWALMRIQLHTGLFDGGRLSDRVPEDAIADLEAVAADAIKRLGESNVEATREVEDGEKTLAPKDKRRRRAGDKRIRPLTARETEAVHLVGEHKGNVSAAARAAGISHQAMKKRFGNAMKKLSRTGVRKPQKQVLPHDRRGQVDL
jgi:hypothetical protein